MARAPRTPATETHYERYQRDPSSLSWGWRRYFAELEGAPRSEVTRGGAGDGETGRPALPRPGGADRDRAGRFLPHVSSIALFRELGEAERELIAARVVEVELAPEQVLFRAGDAGDALYVVVEGTLRVARNEQVLGLIGPGEVAGELALVDRKPRSADVVAHSASRLLALPGAAFDQLVEGSPRLARGLLQVLAARMRQANAQQEKVDVLVRSYRHRGHVAARVDPLGGEPPEEAELTLEYHGLTQADLELPFTLRTAAGPKTLTLRAILDKLRNTYCRSIGVQFTHIDDRSVREWLQFRMEAVENRIPLTREQQLRVLEKLTDAEAFEQFVHRKFLGAKRFSLEGGESLIPLLDMAIEEASRHGLEEIVIGMAHRGRLNVLANVMGKSPRRIFEEFKDTDPARLAHGGDVKYHMGFSSDRVTASGARVHLSLCFNPSHLEVVTPVVLGRVRAKQDRVGDVERKRVMGLVIHGDAAFAGQGVVQEVLNLTSLPGYATGGTLHVIVNNQIGFTTEPRDSRSGRYATDIARTLDTPIFHVNGEDPEAVLQTVHLALEFRAEFRRDVVIDLYCYRRHGHNEGDEPTFTQPVLYRRIAEQPPVREGYLSRLRGLGDVSDAEAEAITARSVRRLEEELARAEAGERPDEPEVVSIWAAFRGGRDRETPEVETGVAKERLSELCRALTAVPAGFEPHPKLERLFQQRREMASGDRLLDWSTGEALAFASLLVEGTHVRLSGQDAERGTFSHRHAVLHDRNDGRTCAPLQNLDPAQARFSVWNSPLSETAVLGFDWGYSLDVPEALVIWEAQFGDFANVAQAVLDQFLTSAEQKWDRLSGLVILLPHGFEGQGPEHSSARLERFLGQAARDNVQVVCPTTPAQIFHALRRQVRRPWRKPLIAMAPKSLLRHPSATSSLDELAGGHFQRVIGDTSGSDPGRARKLLLCTGKVYYELLAGREQRGLDDVHVLRLEQLYPPPDRELAAALGRYPESSRLVWVQEEPRNMGAWTFLGLAADHLWPGRDVTCVSRPESASPATGSAAAHRREQARLVDEALA